MFFIDSYYELLSEYIEAVINDRIKFWIMIFLVLLVMVSILVNFIYLISGCQPVVCTRAFWVSVTVITFGFGGLLFLIIECIFRKNKFRMKTRYRGHTWIPITVAVLASFIMSMISRGSVIFLGKTINFIFSDSEKMFYAFMFGVISVIARLIIVNIDQNYGEIQFHDQHNEDGKRLLVNNLYSIKERRKVLSNSKKDITYLIKDVMNYSIPRSDAQIDGERSYSVCKRKWIEKCFLLEEKMCNGYVLRKYMQIQKLNDRENKSDIDMKIINVFSVSDLIMNEIWDCIAAVMLLILLYTPYTLNILRFVL